MSTDYNIRCVTCTAAKGAIVESWLDECRTASLLALAIEHRGAFEAMVAFMDDPLYQWFSGADHGPTLQLAPFFGVHAGHELRVFDEYGGDWARRDEMCECGHRFGSHYSGGCGWHGDGDHRCEPHEFRPPVDVRGASGEPKPPTS